LINSNAKIALIVSSSIIKSMIGRKKCIIGKLLHFFWMNGYLLDYHMIETP